jgi:hypothetical protein
MHRETIRRQIRLAHEQGVAVATYGKFVMSGLAGWQTAYDRPLDHRFQYNYPVGMWEGVDVTSFDRRRDGDFAVYGKMPSVPGAQPFNNWWASFLPINPDPTPRMARIAAEECVRSVEMFGWDAIRWDGHIRAGGQCGRSGSYDARAARRTQSLTRYFKEIVAERFPDFRHGYNYFLIEPDKGLDWAVGDFELDELCRGGGLLMNESIGNASAGWTFDQVARLAASRDYPLVSAFRPTYNMAANLVVRYDRDQALEVLGRSFAQFQADRASVHLRRRLDEATRALDELEPLDAAAESYVELHQQVAELRSRRRSGRRTEIGRAHV